MKSSYMHIIISEALALYIQKVTVQLSTAKTGHTLNISLGHIHMYIYVSCIFTQNITEVSYVYEPSVHTDHTNGSVHNENIDKDEVHT